MYLTFTISTLKNSEKKYFIIVVDPTGYFNTCENLFYPIE